MIDVILRTCDTIKSVHYDCNGKTDRLVGPEYTKLDIIKCCVNSLVKSMNRITDGIRLIIVDDHSSSEGIERIKQIANTCIHPTEFISLESGTGNGPSLTECYKAASESESDLFYFVEDDYLHDPMCIDEMIYERNMAMSRLNHEVSTFPADNVDNYLDARKNSVPCFMFLGKTRHWRTTTNATSTFMCSKSILDRYLYLFKLMGQQKPGDDTINEDNTTNVIWNAPYKNAGGAYLLSPIPSLAIHFHFKEHVIPYIDWKSWWEKNKEEIKDGSRSKNCKDYS